MFDRQFGSESAPGLRIVRVWQWMPWVGCSIKIGGPTMQNGSRHKSSEAARVGNAQSVFRSVDTRHQGRFWKTYLVGFSPIPKTIFQSPRVHHPTKGLECLASPTKFERDELAMPLARINPLMNNPENLHTNLNASESSVCPPNARLFDGKMMFQTMKFAGGSLKSCQSHFAYRATSKSPPAAAFQRLPPKIP